MGIKLEAPEPVISEDNLPPIASSLFASINPVLGRLNLSEQACADFFSALVELPTKNTPAAKTFGSGARRLKASSAAPDKMFTPFKEAWKETPAISPEDVLRIFAAAVADKTAFGTNELPGMLPNAGWKDLERNCKPPANMIEHMGEYYVSQPAISQG
jgi:hypothetical protein